MIFAILMLFWAVTVFIEYKVESQPLRPGIISWIFLGVSLLAGSYCARYIAQLATICYLEGWKSYASGLRIRQTMRGQLFLNDGRWFGRDVYDLWTTVFLGCFFLVGFLVVLVMFKVLKRYNSEWAAELLRYIKWSFTRRPR
jgi:hypothetical protein